MTPMPCNTQNLPGFVTLATRIAHAHDVEDEMGMGRETPGRAEMRAQIAALGGDPAKMVVTIAEHLEVFDPEEFPGVTLLAFASAPTLA